MTEKKLKFKNKYDNDKLEITVQGSNEHSVYALSNEITCLVLSSVNWERVEE